MPQMRDPSLVLGTVISLDFHVPVRFYFSVLIKKNSTLTKYEVYGVIHRFHSLVMIPHKMSFGASSRF